MGSDSANVTEQRNTKMVFSLCSRYHFRLINRSNMPTSLVRLRGKEEITGLEV